MISITYRITGLMFVVLSLTVLVLTYTVNHQMDVHFHEYLLTQQAGSQAAGGILGLPEQHFLSSVHQSLTWIGGGIALVGLAFSYALAKSITVPLRKLCSATEAIAKGNFGYLVQIETDDEVGLLANTFNKMSNVLAENARLRQRLFADIAHELKTPLAVIQGNLEGMLEGVISVEPEQLNSLYEETVYLNRIIKDLRDLSLAEAGQLILEKQPTDINVLIARVINMLKPLADEKQIELTSQLRPLAEAAVDASRINQVLYNLLTNALRYTPEHGQITVRSVLATEDSRQWIKIEIHDTGIGIAEEELPRIFEHFYRIDKSRDRRSGGSGIGLAIVKRLIEVHGGYVTAESKPGRGSLFTIFLPA